MVRRFFIVLSVFLLMAAAACSSSPATVTSAPPSNVKLVRQTELAGKWIVKQVEINLESSISILLKLADGDTVEGYFYLVKGNSVGFQISGESLIYESKPVSAGSENITSDRFSFTASDAQGIAYTLKFNPDKDSGKKVNTTVFLEVMYPVTGEIFDPMGTK